MRHAAVAEAPAATPNIVEGAIDPSLGLGAREEVAALQILLDRRRRFARRHRRPFRLERRQAPSLPIAG